MAILLALISLGFGIVSLWLFCFVKDDARLAIATPVEEEVPASPTPLLGGRGLAALRHNVFPRSHDRPCSCNARALVWTKDPRRHDAWIGVCRRCGLTRLDVVAGETIET